MFAMMSRNRVRKEKASMHSREKHEKSCKISLDQLMKMVIESAEAEERPLRPASKARAPVRCTMFKVPEPIRQVNRNSYNPRLISFGLYNRVDERWASMEKVKQEVASTVLRVLWEEREKTDVKFKALEGKEKANLIWEHVCANVFSKGKMVSSDQYGNYIRKVYDDPPQDLTLPVVKHLLVLDAIFLVSFMVFLQTDPRSKSIVLRGFQNYKPLLRIFTRAGILCNLNMIAGDIWLFENQIPLSLIGKMVRQMYIQENKSGVICTEKVAAERAFEILVRETVMRVMRVLPGGYRNEPNQETEMDMLFRSINLRRCNHLLECLYRMVCPQNERLRTKKRQKKSSSSELEQMVTSEEKSLGSGWFESRRWGNALVRQHSMFQFTSSETESTSLRSVFGRLSPLSSFKDRVESFKSGNVLAKVHSMFSYPSPSQESVRSATDSIERTGSFVMSNGAQDQGFSEPLQVPDFSQEQHQPLVRPSCDLGAHEQIMIGSGTDVALTADSDISESCSLVSEAGVRKSTNEITHLQVSQLEDAARHIPANGLAQSFTSTFSIGSSRVQSHQQLIMGSSQHISHKLGSAATALDAEDRTTFTEGITDFKTHEVVQPVSAAVLRMPSWQSLSFRYIANSIPQPNKRSPRVRNTSLHIAIDMNFYTLPTLSTLREVGIRVKGDSYPGCRVELKRSSWPWGSSTIQISQLNVDGNTERFLRNLVAFEIVSTSEHSLLTYLQCLDDLINSDEDVRQLKGGKYPVILNCSMNERDVARMFNRMLLNCTVYHNEELQEIRRKVRSYYLQQWRHSLTEFRERYCACSKPWVVLSLMFGFLILGFTALQTAYTVLGNYS